MNLPTEQSVAARWSGEALMPPPRVCRTCSAPVVLGWDHDSFRDSMLVLVCTVAPDKHFGHIENVSVRGNGSGRAA